MWDTESEVFLGGTSHTRTFRTSGRGALGVRRRSLADQGSRREEWWRSGRSAVGGRTLQRPAAGDSLCRSRCLQVSSIGCPFRRPCSPDDSDGGDDQVAICGFVERVTGASAHLCHVDRSACEVCVQQAPLAPPESNPVVASLVFKATQDVDPGDSVGALLGRWATAAIHRESIVHFAPASFACDAILICDPDSPSLTRAVESILQQKEVFTLLHLVPSRAGDRSVPTPIADKANVRVHLADDHPWKTVHELLPQLTAPFLAIQTDDTESESDRLLRAIYALDHRGDDAYVGVVSRGAVDSSSASESQQKPPAHVHWPTFVCRRSSLIERGGLRCNDRDPAAELVNRLFHQGRVTTDEHSGVIAKTGGSIDRPVIELTPWEKSVGHGDGYSASQARCDVVLPFRDQFDFVREAVAGLLGQLDADIVIHLVDDQSTESTAALFAELAEHSNIRFYRNRVNLGPFATFNNISYFAETPFLAVQDADDISLPNRLAESCRLLSLTGADLMGAATELFGEPDLVRQTARSEEIDAAGRTRYLRRSRYPRRRYAGYYMENPSIVMRVDWFRRLGGYADFGESKRNRTGVDTELQARAYYARSHIAISQQVLVRYRCHGHSATNHASMGLGSKPNQESHQELDRRLALYATGSFDPRPFGALSRHRGVTRRVDRP